MLVPITTMINGCTGEVDDLLHSLLMYAAVFFLTPVNLVTRLARQINLFETFFPCTVILLSLHGIDSN